MARKYTMGEVQYALHWYYESRHTNISRFGLSSAWLRTRWGP